MWKIKISQPFIVPIYPPSLRDKWRFVVEKNRWNNWEAERSFNVFYNRSSKIKKQKMNSYENGISFHLHLYRFVCSFQAFPSIRSNHLDTSIILVVRYFFSSAAWKMEMTKMYFDVITRRERSKKSTTTGRSRRSRRLSFAFCLLPGAFYDETSFLLFTRAH